jgi:hypothetical protein
MREARNLDLWFLAIRSSFVRRRYRIAYSEAKRVNAPPLGLSANYTCARAQSSDCEWRERHETANRTSDCVEPRKLRTRMSRETKRVSSNLKWNRRFFGRIMCGNNAGHAQLHDKFHEVNSGPLPSFLPLSVAAYLAGESPRLDSSQMFLLCSHHDQEP